MTVPFENDTGNIVRKLARKSLKSEKRRNLMVVIAVALASCLICFSIVMALSTRQIEKNHVEDTYEAVYTRITEEDVSTLKGLDDFSRVGEYYMLAVEPAEQGYNASYEPTGSGIHIGTRCAGLQYGYVQAVLSCCFSHV